MTTPLVWINGPKKARAKSRRDENWEVFRDEIQCILANHSWEAAVKEVEKLGLLHVTVPKLRAQAREWGYIKRSRVRYQVPCKLDRRVPQHIRNASDSTTSEISPTQSSFKSVETPSTSPEPSEVDPRIYLVRKRNESSCSAASWSSTDLKNVVEEAEIPIALDLPSSSLEFEPGLMDMINIQPAALVESTDHENAKAKRAADFLCSFLNPELAFQIYHDVWSKTGDHSLKMDCADAARTNSQIETIKQILHDSFSSANDLEDVFSTYCLFDQLDGRSRGASTYSTKPLTSFFFEQYITKVLLCGKRQPLDTLRFFNCLTDVMQRLKDSASFKTNFQKAEEIIQLHYKSLLCGNIQMGYTFTGYCGLNPIMTWSRDQIRQWQNPLLIVGHLGSLFGTKEGHILSLFYHLWTAWYDSLQNCFNEHYNGCATCGWAVLQPAEAQLNISAGTILKTVATMIIETKGPPGSSYMGSRSNIKAQYDETELQDQINLRASFLVNSSEAELATKFLYRYTTSRNRFHITCDQADSPIKAFAKKVVKERFDIEIVEHIASSTDQQQTGEADILMIDDTLAPSLRSNSSASYRSFKRTGARNVFSTRSSTSSRRSDQRSSTITVEELTDTISIGMRM